MTARSPAFRRVRHRRIKNRFWWVVATLVLAWTAMAWWTLMNFVECRESGLYLKYCLSRVF